jgi:hypothetical protein
MSVVLHGCLPSVVSKEGEMDYCELAWWRASQGWVNVEAASRLRMIVHASPRITSTLQHCAHSTPPT